MRKLRKRTFAELLKELDPAGQAHENPVDPTTSPMSFPTRKEEVAQRKASKPEPIKPKNQTITKPNKSNSTSSNKYPRGFKKSSEIQQNTNNTQISESTQTIINHLKSTMEDYNVPKPLQQWIITHVPPYIEQFFKKLAEAIEKQIKELFKI